MVKQYTKKQICFIYYSLANKEDIEGHMDEVEIMQTLQLEDLVNINKCPCKMVNLYFVNPLSNFHNLGVNSKI